MARYNHWMNERLYVSAASLTDAQRRQDRGAFFGSLHATLEHLLYADAAWMGRFRGGEPAADTHYAEFTQMQAARAQMDGEIIAWCEQLSADWLATDFEYYSQSYQASFKRPAWILVTHFFNHQTHHRGQITTLLSQCGIDPGITDLPLLPGLG